MRKLGRFAFGGVLVAGAFAMANAAIAQDYPNRPIELVVTFGPGGGADVMGRQLAQILETELGVSIPVTNVAGASGNAGLTRLRTSPADGYTVGTLISLTVASWAADIGDNTPEDFRVLAIVQSTPSFLYVAADSRFETAEQLLDYARDNPGELTVATSGYGTQDDVALITMAEQGFDMVNVPFSAPGERYTAPLGGHTDLIYEEPGDVVQFLESGEYRPLLIFSEARHPEFPDVPTSGELGLNMVYLNTFRTLAVPAATPEDVVARLEAAVVAATQTDAWQAFCAQTYTCLEPVTGEAAQQEILTFFDAIAAQLED
ncbi:MAG: tripartite tricarboxylate transporter substrate binding protein [Roseinatronobacter sp.]|nr:tripartite tricarboxylate transporter substrate binding protein [Roseinatronobacter sp.]